MYLKAKILRDDEKGVGINVKIVDEGTGDVALREARQSGEAPATEEVYMLAFLKMRVQQAWRELNGTINEDQADELLAFVESEGEVT